MTGTKRQDDEEHVEVVLRALNHRMRRRIMRVLVEQKEVVSPTEASELLKSPLSNVSYHFRVLARCKALDMTRERPVRGSMEHFYRANRSVAKMPMVAAVLSATSNSD